MTTSSWRESLFHGGFTEVESPGTKDMNRTTGVSKPSAKVILILQPQPLMLQCIYHPYILHWVHMLVVPHTDLERPLHVAHTIYRHCIRPSGHMSGDRHKLDLMAPQMLECVKINGLSTC